MPCLHEAGGVGECKDGADARHSSMFFIPFIAF